MDGARRRTQLLFGLRRTREATVCVEATHLIEAVGLVTAEKLIQNMAGMISAVRTAYSSKETILHCGNCVVNRERTIEEIEKKNVEVAKAAIDRRMKLS